MPIVLIELPDGEGVVRRDDREIVVTQDVRDEGGHPLRVDDYQPVETWLHGDRSLVGGLLPPGAVSAEVIDGWGARVVAWIGGGAYAAILELRDDHHEPVVCSRDAAGNPVRRPLAGDYPCAPVDDAEEPCPACGSVEYDECVPTENWRGGQRGPDGTIIAPSPIVVCRVCGHEEREGSIMRFPSPDDEDEAARAERIARARAEQRVQQWYAHTLTLRAVTFPVYAAEGWPAQINGSGSQGDDLTELTIAHTETEDADLLDERPRIAVTTSTGESHRDELDVARQKLEHWIHDEIDRPHPPELSDPAITLWFRAVDRRRRAAALAANRSEALITIDGTAAPFLTLTTPSGRWVAVRRHHDLTITIAARELDPTTITIEPIPDPAARLLGPEPEDP